MCLIQFMLKLVTWFDGHVVQVKKTQMTKVVFNFHYRKGIIKSESKFFDMNLLNKFCTLWKVLLLWMNSNIFYLTHVYNAAWWGFTWWSELKLLIIFWGGTILQIQQQFLYTSLLLKFMCKSLLRSVECMPLLNFDF